MKEKKNAKQYIYTRDGGLCYFCGKELLLKKVSLDHYLPRSKGGPDDFFNLVLSCKPCNKLKKSSIPKDYREVMIKLFKKAVRDGKLIGAAIKIKEKELMDLIEEVYKVEDIGVYTVFQSNIYRFYVKQNKIYKLISVNNWSENEG